MAQRKPIVGGNWKMNLHRQDAVALADAVAERFAAGEQVDLFICPAFPYLAHVVEAVERRKNVHVQVGAQDAYDQPEGAYTGEVSLAMLKDVGATVLLVGHSERRHVIGENDLLINRKLRAGLEAGLQVVLCVGETLEQREARQTDAINAGQLAYGLAGVAAEQMADVVIAYEPVWAIGTGKTATPEDAQSAHAAIRRQLAHLFGDQVAGQVRIQYGGSVKPDNAAVLFGQADIDGGLIGGASLKVDDFLAIIDAAK
ncbi:MAG: triose-phosphate isomerase [Phycisphaeraceae bacterium]